MKWDDELRANRVTWRGKTFDSQLEADWCATLCVWGVEHVYHPGRVYLPVAGVWEPDFHVDAGDRDLLLEVKGGHDHRIEKVWEARSEGYNVIVGRGGWIPAGSDIEVAGAVWETADWVVELQEDGGLRFAEAERATRWHAYPAMYAYEHELDGITMMKALGDGVQAV